MVDWTCRTRCAATSIVSVFLPCVGVVVGMEGRPRVKCKRGGVLRDRGHEAMDTRVLNRLNLISRLLLYSTHANDMRQHSSTTVQHSRGCRTTLQHTTQAQHNTAQHSIAQHSTTTYRTHRSTARHSAAQHISSTAAAQQYNT